MIERANMQILICKYLKDIRMDYFFYSGYGSLHKKYQLIKFLEIRHLTKIQK